MHIVLDICASITCPQIATGNTETFAVQKKQVELTTFLNKLSLQLTYKALKNNNLLKS